MHGGKKDINLAHTLGVTQGITDWEKVEPSGMLEVAAISIHLLATQVGTYRRFTVLYR